MESVDNLRLSLDQQKGKDDVDETSATPDQQQPPAPNPLQGIDLEYSHAGTAITDYLELVNQPKATNQVAQDQEKEIQSQALRAMQAYPELFLKIYEELLLSLPKQVKLVRLFQGAMTVQQNSQTPMDQSKLDSIAKSLITDKKYDPLLRLMFGINPHSLSAFLGAERNVLLKTLNQECRGFEFALNEAHKNPAAILDFPHAVQWSYALDERHSEEVKKPGCGPFVRGLIASPNAPKTYFKFFYGHKAVAKSEYERAMDILSDYQSFVKILFRHWGRHHVGFVREVIKAEKNLAASEKTLPALLERIERQKALYVQKMQTKKPKKFTGDHAQPVIKEEGSLGRRLGFLTQQRDSKKLVENKPQQAATPPVGKDGDFPAYDPEAFEERNVPGYNPDDYGENGELLAEL